MSRIRDIGLFGFEKRRQRGDTSVVCNYVIRGYRKDVDRFFLIVCIDEMRNNKHKVECGKSQLDNQELFGFFLFIFTVRVIK